MDAGDSGVTVPGNAVALDVVHILKSIQYCQNLLMQRRTFLAPPAAGICLEVFFRKTNLCEQALFTMQTGIITLIADISCLVAVSVVLHTLDTPQKCTFQEKGLRGI